MKQLAIIPIVLVLMTSCLKMDETVYSSIHTENFYKNASDAEKALFAAYSSVADLSGTPVMLLVPEFSADQLYPRPVVGRNTLTQFSYDANYTAQKTAGRESESPQSIWKFCYAGIESCNWVIEKVPGAAMDETRKRQIVGEARFLRAFYHWMLTKNFGDVPVKIRPSVTEQDAIVGDSPKAAVYQQIYQDLEEAANAGFPSFPQVESGRPSREAVDALYAKAAIYNEDWDVALAKAEAVIQSGVYALMADVTKVFTIADEEAARVENIWAFEGDYLAPGRSTSFPSLLGPPGSSAPEYAKTTFGSVFAYQNFFNSFDPKDTRRKLLDTNYVNKSGQIVAQKDITPITPRAVLVKKYQDPVQNGPSCNIPILRLADIYLIAAEAAFRLQNTSKALQYLNVVRRRAFGVALDAPSDFDLAVVDEDVILQERSWELYGEGDRWYDLTRTGKFLSVIPGTTNDVFPSRPVEERHRYFPIPQDEINANPLITQNPLWD